MNLLEACEYILANPKAVLKIKGAKEPREILRKRGYHVCNQTLNPLRPVYEGGVPLYMNSHTIRTEWEETGMTFEQVKKRAEERYAAEEAENLRRYDEAKRNHANFLAQQGKRP